MPLPIKNIAVLAHIDAGKTTLSERLLYMGKTIHNLGEVEEGLATMDYLAAEKKRGITIEAGWSHFAWKKQKINLVDTPGHIDFGSEVDCVLDSIEGAVLVISGTRGVQTQTLVNWNKLQEFQKPTLFFLNKCDLPEFEFDNSLIDIEEQTERTPLLLTLPCEWEGLYGVLDILSEKMVLTKGMESRDVEILDIPDVYGIFIAPYAYGVLLYIYGIFCPICIWEQLYAYGNRKYISTVSKSGTFVPGFCVFLYMDTHLRTRNKRVWVHALI